MPHPKSVLNALPYLGLTEAGLDALARCATTGKAAGVAADKLKSDGFLTRRKRSALGAPTAKGFEALRVARAAGARL